MAAKRTLIDKVSDRSNQQNEKKVKVSQLSPSVPGEFKLIRSFSSKGLIRSLEPFIRKVVSEEVEHGIQRSFARRITRSPSIRIQAPEPSNLHLIFKGKPSLFIFTNSKILDTENNPLQILLVNINSAGETVPITPPYPLKLEIVAVAGDFDCDDLSTWTADEFKQKIVEKRDGKRPLLAGDLIYTMKGDGVVEIGDIEFTDNSSWIRGRRFRIGARVVARVGESSGRGVRVLEAVTSAFVVKDQRGESYKKHYPPRLSDEVWRLEKIGKDGKFHKKLAKEKIITVQDFLKLATIDPCRLRNILGHGMSKKMWQITLNHALTCEMGNELYVAPGPETFPMVFLNPICEIVKVAIDGQTYNIHELSSATKAIVEELARSAYERWDSLQARPGYPVNEMPRLTRGEVMEGPNYDYQDLAPVTLAHGVLPLNHEPGEFWSPDQATIDVVMENGGDCSWVNSYTQI